MVVIAPWASSIAVRPVTPVRRQTCITRQPTHRPVKGSTVDAGTVVHGDLHHHNILDAGTRYIAIDPKPMLGEPEFDVPPFLWNPLGSRMTQEETERRLAAFAEAGLDEVRMRAWALIRGAYLDVGDWIGEHAVHILEAIQP